MRGAEAFDTGLNRFMAAFGARTRSDLVGERRLAVDGKSLYGVWDMGSAHLSPLKANVFVCEIFMSLTPALAAEATERASIRPARWRAASMRACL